MEDRKAPSANDMEDDAGTDLAGWSARTEASSNSTNILGSFGCCMIFGQWVQKTSLEFNFVVKFSRLYLLYDLGHVVKVHQTGIERFVVSPKICLRNGCQVLEADHIHVVLIHDLKVSLFLKCSCFFDNLLGANLE